MPSPPTPNQDLAQQHRPTTGIGRIPQPRRCRPVLERPRQPRNPTHHMRPRLWSVRCEGDRREGHGRLGRRL